MENQFTTLENAQQPGRDEKQEPIDKNSKHTKYIPCNSFIVIYEKKLLE